ncbi:cytochrome b/b6 domain-containing protein [Microbacterium gorillae]|uniref:cytochrome b/b6 domain-containing protein n=1 Tax=Microbacterium gorillae TaxID=1231063 RepID=UPI001E5B75AC|nr:cytochrome b/b6 domain-containing protein [Microbacterium gorillae]
MTGEPVAATETPAAVVAPVAPGRDVSVPLAAPTTVWAGKNANVHPVAVEPRRYGPLTAGQWVGAVIVGGIGLLFAAAMVVFFMRWIVSLDGVRSFMHTYPGEYDLPASSTPGFPLWAQWQHYLNIFMMALIIRTGWLVRTQARPEAFWSARWTKDDKKKISIMLWLHQSVDIFWFLNGIIFVVLLFASGHWMRVVPTSWEVFPNALTALMKYISLDWPTEHGWVNYNSLQQIMYFLTIFIAAPLAAITGVRMSGLWPKNAKTLNKIYPVEVARAIHFPVMLYFVVFIVIHVFLVFSTGALRNLNHMFGNSDNVNWVGFWFFFAGMVVVVAALAAVRPLVLAPIAKLTGKVSQR